MRRRKYIIGMGTVAASALSGCTSGDDQDADDGDDGGSPDSEDGDNSDESVENDSADGGSPEDDGSPLEPAEFEFADISPGDVTVGYGEQVDVEATIRNTGEQDGSVQVDYRIANESVDEASYSLGGGEETTIVGTLNTLERGEGSHQYGFYADSEQITGTLTVEVDEPSTQSFSGTGQSVEAGVEIQGGLTVVEATHDGESNFQVSLVDDSEFDDIFVNVIGQFDGSQAELIGGGTYTLDVNADGAWEVDIHQPRAGSGTSLPESLSGSGPDVVGPIDFDGTHIAEASHSGSSNFQVVIYPSEGSFGEHVFNEIGDFDGETTFNHPGLGWVDVNADGSWSLQFE